MSFPVTSIRFSVDETGISKFVQKFTSLDILVLHNLKLDVNAQHYSKQFSLAWIPGVLRRLSSLIHRLVFEVSASRDSQLDMVLWPFVDELVSDPQNTKF